LQYQSCQQGATILRSLGKFFYVTTIDIAFWNDNKEIGSSCVRILSQKVTDNFTLFSIPMDSQEPIREYRITMVMHTRNQLSRAVTAITKNPKGMTTSSALATTQTSLRLHFTTILDDNPHVV
jgi:hypothetical protein